MNPSYRFRGISPASSMAEHMPSFSDMSDVSSIPSTQTSFSSIASDSDDCSPYYNYKPTLPPTTLPPLVAPVTVIGEPLRRRAANLTRSRTLPQLVRQSDRKVLFVESLVESATLIVEAIWPGSDASTCQYTSRSPLKLRTFIEETLRRSRTSYSTLQVAMYYLILIKSHVPRTAEEKESFSKALQCGRRMFLVALILASKYLQDRNYSAKAWSKMSGLPTSEINWNEISFLQAINWKLHITEELFTRWTTFGLNYPPPPPDPDASIDRAVVVKAWQRRILDLDTEILNVDLSPKNTVSMYSHYHNPAQSRRSSIQYLECGSSAPKPRVPTLQRHATFPMAAYPTPPPCAISTPSSISRSSIGMAFDQASVGFTSHSFERSQLRHAPTGIVRRTSPLASISSSPESLISDDSRSVVSVASGPSERLVSLPPALVLTRSQICYAQPKSFSHQYNQRPSLLSESVTIDFGLPQTQSPIGVDADRSVAHILQGMPQSQPTYSLKNKRSYDVMSYNEHNDLQNNMRHLLKTGRDAADLPLTPPDVPYYNRSNKRARYSNQHGFVLPPINFAVAI